MRKQTITSIICFAVALALLISCAANGNTEQATVRFHLGVERTRTIAPEDAVVTTSSYRFTFKSNSSELIKTLDISDDDTYEIAGILPGYYTVTVEALNNSSEVLAEASTNYRFLPGLNSYSITLDSLSGMGSLAVDFSWDKDLFIDNEGEAITSTLVLSLKNQSNTTVAIAEDALVMNAEEGTASLSMSDLPAGSYLLSIQLKNGSSFVSGTVEVIRIADNTTSSGSIKLDGKLLIKVEGFGVTDLTSAPIKATITPNKIFEEGDEPTAATFTITFTSLPKGITEDDITIEWYTGDFFAGRGKNASLQPDSGTTRITAVYKCSKLGSMGSTSIDFFYPLH